MSETAADPVDPVGEHAGEIPFQSAPVARYAPHSPGPWYRGELATGVERMFLALFGLAGSIVLTIAMILPPAGAGHGTHQALGLPPCSFLAVTGLPCLSCGMTTSFAHTVRGEMPSALAAQPFGTLLAVVTILLVPVFFAGALTGRSVSRPIGRLPWNRIGPVLLALLFAAWGYKIAAMRGVFG